VHHFAALKADGTRISVVTAYDYPTALAADAAGADAILVGDSLGMVALGYDSTVPVTLEAMLHHTAAVRRGTRRAFLIADLPFLSYGICSKASATNAGRLVKEAGAEAVKLEGGKAMAPTVEKIVSLGIPVLAHIGLLPQSVNQQGGYRVQGRDASSAEVLLQDALAMQSAGAFAVVLEGIPADVAAKITSSLEIPTIGIGAGRHCDGQVLVLSDLLGMLPGRVPRFVRQYANLNDQMTQALKQFSTDVREGRFPSEENEY